MIREYYDVKQEAPTFKQVVHFARVHGIIVEKNYQLPENDEGRKFKGRGVLMGNKVKNQNWEILRPPLNLQDGQISTDAFQVIRSSLQMLVKPTFSLSHGNALLGRATVRCVARRR